MQASPLQWSNKWININLENSSFLSMLIKDSRATFFFINRGPPVIDMRRDCQLAFGKHDIQQMESTQVKDNTIGQGFIHPKFDPIGFTDHYDLALLKLANPLKFNDAIQPICLPFGIGELPYNKTCYATGWGLTALGK